jgi:hypothetical protein
MKLPMVLRSPAGVDPLRVAGVFGALAGVGSLVEPYLLGLTEALAAIGLVAWLARAGGGSRGRPWGLALAVGVAGAELVSFFAGPPASSVRGVFLGLGTAALAATAGPPASTPEAGA